MDPTLRQLEVFLAVAKAGSFRRAADGLHLSAKGYELWTAVLRPALLAAEAVHEAQS